MQWDIISIIQGYLDTLADGVLSHVFVPHIYAFVLTMCGFEHYLKKNCNVIIVMQKLQINSKFANTEKLIVFSCLNGYIM